MAELQFRRDDVARWRTTYTQWRDQHGVWSTYVTNLRDVVLQATQNERVMIEQRNALRDLVQQIDDERRMLAELHNFP